MRAGGFIPPEMNNEATNNVTTMSNAQRTMVGKRSLMRSWNWGGTHIAPGSAGGKEGCGNIQDVCRNSVINDDVSRWI